MRTTFVCSRSVPSTKLIKIYDWATETRDNGITVISGFHSKVEKDVFHFLAKGKQPLIMVLAKRMYKRIPKDLKPLVENGRLQILSPFDENALRTGEYPARIRNRYMIEMSEEVVIGHVTPGGNLEKLLAEYEGTGKRIVYL